MSSASTSASKFATTLKNIALNAGIMIAVTLGIKAVTAAWDYFNNTVEEQEEKINNLKSSYEGLKSEYDTLSQKQDLTDAEKRRLEYLERRLELDQKILEAEEKMLFEEKYGDKFTDWFDKDNQNVKYSSENNMYNYDGYARQKHNYNSDLNQINKTQQQIELYEKRQAQLTKGSNAYLELENRILNLREKEKKQIEDISKQENQLTVNLGKYANEIESIQSDLENPNLSGEDRIKAEEQLNLWKEMYKETDAMIINIQRLNGTYKDTENIIENISGNKDSSNVEFLGISETVAQINSTLKPAIDSLAESYNDIFTEDGFTRENIGLDMINSIQKELDELSEAEINIDSSSLDNLIKVLNDTESSAEEIKDAFDEVAYSIASASLSGLEDFETLKNSLKELGYVEFELTAFESLVQNKEALLQAGIDLDAATEEQIATFANEIVSVENVAHAIDILTYAKQLNKLQDMDTSDEVANLKTLAENAGYTGNVIKYLTELEQIYQEVAKGTLSPNVLNARLARADELKTLIEAESSKINFAQKANTQDWKPVIDSAGKAGKDAGEEYKEALEKELKDLDTIVSYVTNRLDKQADALQKQSDVAVDSLEAQKDAAREAYESQQKAIDAQIKAKEKQIESIRAQIDAIQDENEAIKLQADLEQAKFEAEQLRKNKTIRQYGDIKGIHYTTDSRAIRKKDQEVDEKKDEIKINEMEQSIKQIEKSIDLLEEQKEAIDEMIEQSDAYFDNLTTQTEAYYNAMIENLNEYKSRWEQLTELEETAKMEAKLKELGITTEDLANMSEENFQRVKNAYIDTLREAYVGNDAILEQLNILDSTDMSGINSELGITTEKFGELENTNLSALSENMSEASNSANGLSEDVSSISSSISNINNENISTATSQFTLLSEAIEGVATALGIDGDGTVSSLVTALNSLNEVNLGGMSENGSGTGIIAQFNALKTAVDDVTSAISGGGSKANENGGLATGINGGSATPNMSGDGANGLIGSIDKLQQNTDKALGTGSAEKDEGTGIIGKFSALKTAIDDVTDAIGTTDDNSLDKGASNLISAIQLESKVVGNELPNQISLFQELLDKINECVASLGNMANAIQGASGSLSGFSFGGQTPQFLAKGTNHAKEGLTVVGEEAPELIEHNNGKLSLVTEPTLVNMEGGEKVYNGEETKSLLNPKQKQMLQDFMKHGLVRDDVIVKVNEDESPLLKARNLNLVQNAWSMQMQDLLSSPKPVQTVNNRTQTIEQHNQFNVTLPNINDSSKAVQLANELKRLPLQTMQYAHRR